MCSSLSSGKVSLGLIVLGNERSSFESIQSTFGPLPCRRGSFLLGAPRYWFVRFVTSPATGRRSLCHPRRVGRSLKNTCTGSGSWELGPGSGSRVVGGERDPDSYRGYTKCVSQSTRVGTSFLVATSSVSRFLTSENSSRPVE